jgi:hypothetical protein
MKKSDKANFVNKHSAIKSVLTGAAVVLGANNASEIQAQNNVSADKKTDVMFSLGTAVRTSRHIITSPKDEADNAKNDETRINLIRFLAKELKEEISGALDCIKNTTRFASEKGTDIVGECQLSDGDGNEVFVSDNKFILKLQHGKIQYVVEGNNSSIASELSKGGKNGLEYPDFYKLSYKAAKSKEVKVRERNIDSKTAVYNDFVGKKNENSL